MLAAELMLPVGKTITSAWLAPASASAASGICCQRGRCNATSCRRDHRPPPECRCELHPHLERQPRWRQYPLDKSGWGVALQAGPDIELKRNWSIHLDLKTLQLRSDVYPAGQQVSRLKIDPVLIGVGLGYRFL